MKDKRKLSKAKQLKKIGGKIGKTGRLENNDVHAFDPFRKFLGIRQRTAILVFFSRNFVAIIFCLFLHRKNITALVIIRIHYLSCISLSR